MISLLSFFILGTIVGSFLNVVALRMERGEDFVQGRSACPHCGSLIHWYDNIPLFSFLFLRGRCRGCHDPISWRYPAVELLTGIGYAVLATCFFNPIEASAWIETLWLLGLFSLFLVIALYDSQTMEIPIALLQASAVWTLVFILWLDWTVATDMLWSMDGRTITGLIGAGVAWMIFASLSFFSKETWMGWGDAWLAAIIGLAVGIEGLLFALTLSFGCGAIFSIILLIRKQAGMETRVPFGPFLVIGTFVYFVLLSLGFFRYGLLWI